MKPEFIRSFVCVALEPQIQKKIGVVQEELIKKIKSTTNKVSWVKPETIHLTLKFLGEVEVNRIEAIKRSLYKAVSGINPFSIKIEGLGVFPNIKKPRVIWIGISEGAEVLKKVQIQVEQALSEVGFPREKDKFSPHLTMGRLRFLEDAAALNQVLTSVPFPVVGLSMVSDVRLMKSELHPSGAIHTQLERIGLV